MKEGTIIYERLTFIFIFNPHLLKLRPLSLAGSTAKFDAASSYAQDFVAKELPRQAAFIPRARAASGGKFDATTSYAVHFLSFTYHSTLKPDSSHLCYTDKGTHRVKNVSVQCVDLKMMTSQIYDFIPIEPDWLSASVCSAAIATFHTHSSKPLA